MGNIPKKHRQEDGLKVFNEANLAEFPLFLLTKTAECDYIKYEDAIDYQGKHILRQWTVT
jgi:hypothetical protein